MTRLLHVSSHVHATITEEGGMLLDVRRRGRWHVLTPAAVACWPHLARGDIDAATQELMHRWGIPAKQAYADVGGLVRQLDAARLLVRPRRHGWRWWWR
ncbi:MULTISPECIES: PqqD family peptide modification chaperone [unclassified Nonomuraea]